MNSDLAQRAVQVGFLVVAGLAWQISVSTGRVNPLILPPLATVGKQFWSLIASGRFWPDLSVTLTELIAAFVLAAVSGCGIGYAISRSAFSVRVFDPLLATIYAVPAILLYPMYVLFFGIGPGSKIAIGCTIAFFPIVLSTITGFSNVNRSLLAAARSMGASGVQMFADVMLPASFPIVLAGLRLGLVIALLSILGAETISSLSGVGHEISSLAENFETATMFAWVFIAVLLAFTLNALATAIERRAWRTTD